MLQNEIDEISDAFNDAWNEFFGQEMFYIPFKLSSTVKHPVYGESKQKVYDHENKLKFMGTYKVLNDEEKGELFGAESESEAGITFVTKELFEQGVLEVDKSALIEITHRSGKTVLYNIIDAFGKVQFGDNRIFTQLGVVPNE